MNLADFNYMILESPKLSEPVEISGISFQTMISSSILTIPEKTLNHTTPFQIGMKITNNSTQDYYFLRFPSYLDIEQYSNLELQRVYPPCTDSWYVPRDIHVVCVKSGKFNYLSYKGTIAWHRPYHAKRYKNRKRKDFSRILPLQEEYSQGEEATYYLEVSLDLGDETASLGEFIREPLSYRIKGKYCMSENAASGLKFEGRFLDGSKSIEPNISDKMWVGIVHTPFLEFQLV